MAHFQKSQKATYGPYGPKTSKNYGKIREHMAGYKFFDFKKILVISWLLYILVKGQTYKCTVWNAITDWRMGSSWCGTVNRKQEVSNIGCWELIAWRSLSLIAWHPSCATVPTVVRHPFLLFSSLFSSLSIPNSKVLFNGHLFIVFVTCEKLLYAFENCQNDAWKICVWELLELCLKNFFFTNNQHLQSYFGCYR